jgi:hypothetical protein
VHQNRGTNAPIEAACHATLQIEPTILSALSIVGIQRDSFLLKWSLACPVFPHAPDFFSFNAYFRIPEGVKKKLEDLFTSFL